MCSLGLLRQVNLVGGLANCFMGFILPPLLHIRVEGDAMSGCSKAAHYLIVIFGFITMVTATVVTIQNIVDGPTPHGPHNVTAAFAGTA